MQLRGNIIRAFVAHFLFLLLLVFGVILPSPSAVASSDDKGLMEFKLAKKPEKLDKAIEKSIDYIFDFMNMPQGNLDTAQLEAMLHFVVGMQSDPKDIAPKRRFGGNGICLRKDAKTTVHTLLQYFYNPDIPNYLLCPSVLRYSGWYEGTGIMQLERPLWEQLEPLDQPVVVRGKEYESTAPDAFAEAYYSYDINRLIVLLKYKGKKIAISVSKQRDKSDVGRKGAILNNDTWDYFYSGLEGLNKGGMGWMDTFMYDSASIQIFVEEDTVAPRTSVFLFKWLKAGWASMNVVKRKHIYDGALRYVTSMKQVLESAELSPAELTRGMRDVLALDAKNVDSKIMEYSQNFENHFKDNPKMHKKEYAAIIRNGGYYKVLDDQARRAILVLQKLKSMLGMETFVSFDKGSSVEAEDQGKSPLDGGVSLIEADK